MNRKLPPLVSLVAFESVVRRQTIAAAADELSITPSAVSQRIKHLEDWYGFRLFERSNGRLYPTEKGRLLAEVCTNSFEQIIQVSDSFIEKEDTGEINISCLPSFAYLCLLRKLKEFESFGEYRINLNTSNNFVDLTDSTYDLAIRYTNKTQDPKLNFDLIAREVVYPCVSPAVIDQVGTTDLKAIIQKIPLIMDSGLGLDIKPNWQKWIEQYERFDFEDCPSVMFSDYQFAVKCALEGQGVLLARNVIVGNKEKRGDLVRINLNELQSEAGYFLVTRKDASQRRSVQKFINWFKSEFSSIGSHGKKVGSVG